VRRWGRERGDRVLHLGGGRGGREDSLFAFKSRFSKRRHPFYTGRWILDPQAYRELVAGRQRLLERSGRRVAGTGWFPLYRAPLEQPTPVAIPIDGGIRLPARQPVAIRVEPASSGTATTRR
jgi:hypothetical protein